MLGDVVSRPYNGVERAKGLDFSLTDYGIKISYDFFNTSRKYTFNFGFLTEVEESRMEDHLDEMRHDTNWEVTSKDLRNGQKPYDCEEEKDAEELYTFLLSLKPFEPSVSNTPDEDSIPPLLLSKLAEIDEYEDYEPEDSEI